MNKSFKKFLKIYLVIGVFWGLLARFPFGVMLSEYSGNHRYPNRITEIEKSFISDKGDIVLCLKGRLSMSDIDDSPIEKFSLKIPIQEILVNEKYNQNGIRVSEDEAPWVNLSSNIISPKCDSKSLQLKNISISEVDLTPKKALS